LPGDIGMLSSEPLQVRQIGRYGSSEACWRGNSERFSSSDLAGLKNADRFGQFARHGQQRSLRRMRKVLSWALARSPGLRSWACARLASF
jgi:hypothetical protein